MDLVLLRESAPYISISLANVINKSLKSDVFEQDWKNAIVTPIYKDDGDINDENNYRPISSQTSLHLVVNDWLENVNGCARTGACLLDISKCFDSINHTIRLKKLEM